MPTVEVRRLTGPAMIEPFLDLTRYAFEASPPLYDEKKWREEMEALSDSRAAVVYVDGQPVACAASSPMTQNVRGQIVPMGGIWGVATHPLHRFQGYARRAMQELFAAEHEAGTPVSMLYAFRESWYEKLGYVQWPQPRTAIIKATNLKPLTRLAVNGDLEWLTMSEGYETYLDYLKTRQRVVHGMALTEYSRDKYFADKNRWWIVVARVNGEIVGALTYKIKGQPDDLNELIVSRFTYSTVAGRYLLLKFLASHFDQVQTVKITLPPDEHPEIWHSDLFVEVEGGDPPLGRVINVAALNDQAVGRGSFVAHIRDPLCPWNEHTLKFASVDGQLDVTPSDGRDCTLSIQALSALIYGVRDPAEFAIHGWGDPSPELQQTMRTMFPKKMPWLHKEF